jgi:hypothetical protein
MRIVDRHGTADDLETVIWEGHGWILTQMTANVEE